LRALGSVGRGPLTGNRFSLEALGSVGRGTLTGNRFSLEALRAFRTAVADR
jgi:hypothetical protein